MSNEKCLRCEKESNPYALFNDGYMCEECYEKLLQQEKNSMMITVNPMYFVKEIINNVQPIIDWEVRKFIKMGFSKEQIKVEFDSQSSIYTIKVNDEIKERFKIVPSFKWPK